MITRDPVAAAVAALMLLVIAPGLYLLLGRRYGVVGIALIALALRAARGLYALNTGPVDDALGYDIYGQRLALFWQGMGPDPGTWVGKDGFPAVLGAVYYAIGHAPEVGYALNAVAGGLAVIVVAATTKEMGWDRAIRPAAWAMALWPVGIIWGGALLRESIVTLLLAIASWGAVRIYQHRAASGLLAIAVTGVAMIFMRGGLAFLVLAGMPLVAVLASNLRVRGSPGRLALAGGISGLALIAVFLLSSYFESAVTLQYEASILQDTNQGTSSFGQAGLGGTWVAQSLVGHALRVPITAFGPFPWQVTNLSLAQAFIDAALWFAVWALAIYATRRLTVRIEAALFLFPTAALIVALAANAGNFGLIIRLRGQALALIVPLAALGFVHWRDRRAEKRLQSAEIARPRSRSPVGRSVGGRA
jgi:hypothetical protein